MESNQELRHWGVKGQKWGIRRYQNPDGTLTEAGKRRYRYQNPDGSLTEEGKADFMNLAKKGKLNLETLSNADIDMINQRFQREATYKQNVQKYVESTFSYKLKKALIDRISGGGNNNQGKGKGKGKGKNSGGLAAILATPIKKAFEEAFKEDKDEGKGKDKSEDKNDKPKNEKKPKNASNSNASLDRLIGWTMNTNLDSIERGEQKKIKAGKEAAPRLFSRTLERILESEPQQKSEFSFNSRRLDDIEREGWSKHSGIYAISRSDELYHHGIKGQKWGVRRFENPDGTLTEEGKRRYDYIKLDLHSELNRARENKKIAAKKLMDANFLTKARAAKAAAAADEKFKEVENVYNDLLKHQKEVDEYNKREFDAAKKEIHENGFESWWNKNRSTDNEDAFCDHIWNTQGKLLDSWWNERYELDYDDGSWKRVQQKYVKQLAKNLGLPQTKEVNEYLSDWFVNGDD